MKLKKILFFLATLYCFVVLVSSNEDDGRLTDYFTPFTHLEFTDEPVTRYYNLELKQTTAAPDGFERITFTADDLHPGPILRANKGDRIVVKVNNKLGDPTGIHWHGMFQLGTSWFDGAPGFTQCPIPDGDSLTYDFSTGKQFGTYWWHSHHLSQYIDGVRGALILHDPADPYLSHYDEEYVVAMADWYHDSSKSLVPRRTAPGYGGFNPVPDAGLISGRGRYNCTAAPPGSKCDPEAPLAVYKFEKGKKYRLRLISMSADVMHMFSIDEHKMKVIEIDGEYVKPYTVEKLPINIAQRYSVIVEADRDIKNYFIRATIQKECVPINNQTINFDSAINYNAVGILKYVGADDKYPETEESSEKPEPCKDLPVGTFEPLYPAELSEPYESFSMNVTFGVDSIGAPAALINGNTFKPDFKYPTVNKILDGVNPDSLKPDQVAFVYDKPDKVVEIVVLNSNRGVHPFHLHGHSFQINGIGDLPLDRSKLNTKNALVRDTVTIPGNSWAVLRYVADNPGVWGFHCHIEWHMAIGLAAQMVELPTEFSQRKLPEELKSICNNSYKTKRKLRRLRKL